MAKYSRRSRLAMSTSSFSSSPLLLFKMSSYVAALSSTFVAISSSFADTQIFAALSATFIRRTQDFRSRPFTIWLPAESSSKKAYARKRPTMLLLRGLSSLKSLLRAGSSRRSRVDRFQSSVPSLSSSSRFAATAGEGCNGNWRICICRSERRDVSWGLSRRGVRLEAKATSTQDQ